ncbi:THO complex subunit 4A-like [Quillaja saponaria]|uniref:THO complex subunit 4A-like n=1 Tax=Quillaja saponaria TaxID=32244 RepID=A0AAD7Q6N9_QUISA|nr:THO complex subunit 4A-like [Quillaja saponaria]
MPIGLDMSLDDMIKINKKSARPDSSFRVRDRGSGGPRPDRRFVNRKPVRTAPYPVPQKMRVPQPLFPHEIVLSGGSGAETGTKLYVSNLDYGVSNDDIKVSCELVNNSARGCIPEVLVVVMNLTTHLSFAGYGSCIRQLLFSDVGELRRYSIHYDKSGRSKGTAEVVFLRESDALAAIKRYNNVKLDGKPLKIELVGVNLVSPAVVPPLTSSMLGRPGGTFKSGQGKVGTGGWVRSGNGGGRVATGQGGERVHGDKVTAKDLDADLEKYHLEAMKINTTGLL